MKSSVHATGLTSLNLKVPLAESKSKVIASITALVNAAYNDHDFSNKLAEIKPEYHFICPLNRRSALRVLKSLHIRELYETI